MADKQSKSEEVRDHELWDELLLDELGQLIDAGPVKIDDSNQYLLRWAYAEIKRLYAKQRMDITKRGQTIQIRRT